MGKCWDVHDLPIKEQTTDTCSNVDESERHAKLHEARIKST